MGLFFYTQKGSIISMVVSPTTEIIEPFKTALGLFFIYILPYLTYNRYVEMNNIILFI